MDCFTNGSASYHFPCIDLKICTKSHTYITIRSNVTEIAILAAWDLVPQSKHSIRRHFFEKVDIISFLVYKLCISTKFHVPITIYSYLIIMTIEDFWKLVARSKCSNGGILGKGLYHIFFSVPNCVSLPRFTLLS